MTQDRNAHSNFPSPLEGEGASRSEAGEGQYHRRHDEWRTGLTPTLRLRAKTMRTNATEAEALMWKLLRDRRFVGFKFRRQLPIGRFIVDFVCPSAMLIVELDGSQHAEDKRDLARDAWLTSRGYRVLRIWNSDLFTDRSVVLDAIWHALHPAPHPPFGHPLPQGERGDVAQPSRNLPPNPEGEGASRSEAGEGQFSRDNRQ